MHNPVRVTEAFPTLPFLGPTSTPTHASLGGSSVAHKFPGKHSLEPSRTDDI